MSTENLLYTTVSSSIGELLPSRRPHGPAARPFQKPRLYPASGLASCGCSTLPGRRPARFLLRRSSTQLRSAAPSSRNGVSAQSLGRTRGDSLRRDDFLLGASSPHRQPKLGPRRRLGQRQEPPADCRPLSPRHWQQRRAGRLRRRAADQKSVARPRRCACVANTGDGKLSSTRSLLRLEVSCPRIALLS